MCIALVLTVNVSASPKLIDTRNLIFDRLGFDQGLSQVTISTIIQDRNGFMWIGTQEGLNRYDGHSFETYYHIEDDPNSLVR
jgi:ligand-binding sensor domain-containing protein